MHIPCMRRIMSCYFFSQSQKKQLADKIRKTWVECKIIISHILLMIVPAMANSVQFSWDANNVSALHITSICEQKETNSDNIFHITHIILHKKLHIYSMDVFQFACTRILRAVSQFTRNVRVQHRLHTVRQRQKNSRARVAFFTVEHFLFLSTVQKASAYYFFEINLHNGSPDSMFWRSQRKGDTFCAF